VFIHRVDFFLRITGFSEIYSHFHLELIQFFETLESLSRAPSTLFGLIAFQNVFEIFSKNFWNDLDIFFVV
jgi:hypothetical protein